MKNIIFFIICILSTQILSAQEKKWEFKIELDKQEYLLEENIWLDVSITNISEDTLFSIDYIPSSGCGFDFIVQNSLGQEVLYSGTYTNAAFKPRTYPILPGQQIYACFNLKNLYYSLSYSTGEFSIQGFVDLPFKNECYFDDLKSNKLQFTISEPTGSEKGAYQLISAAYDENRFCSADTAITIYQQVLDSFPQSVYGEESYSKVIIEKLRNIDNRPQKEIDYIALANKCLFKYPNSGHTKSFLQRILYLAEKTDMKMSKRLMQSTIQASKNTRLNKLAKRIQHVKNRVLSSKTCESIVDSTQLWIFEIGLSKNSFANYEDIWLDMTITNITSDTLKADWSIDPYYGNLELNMKDSMGNIVQKIDNMTVCYAFWNSESSLIEPGGEIYTCINLNSFFGHQFFLLPRQVHIIINI